MARAKSAAELKAAGTFRKDRHSKLETPPVIPAEDFSAPDFLAQELRPRWDEIIIDLKAIGAVTRTDVVLLGTAFGMLSNSQKFQALLDDALENAPQETGDLARLQTSAAGAASAFLKLVQAVRQGVKLNSRPQEKDEFGSWLNKKK